MPHLNTTKEKKKRYLHYLKAHCLVRSHYDILQSIIDWSLLDWWNRSSACFIGLETISKTESSLGTNLRACIRVLISTLPATPACSKHIVSISFCSSSLSENNRSKIFFFFTTDRDEQTPRTDMRVNGTQGMLIIKLIWTYKLATPIQLKNCLVIRTGQLQQDLHSPYMNQKLVKSGGRKRSPQNSLGNKSS